ncbi:unnamed protein product, partial [Linum tenue]
PNRPPSTSRSLFSSLSFRNDKWSKSKNTDLFLFFYPSIFLPYLPSSPSDETRAKPQESDDKQRPLEDHRKRMIQKVFTSAGEDGWRRRPDSLATGRSRSV